MAFAQSTVRRHNLCWSTNPFFQTSAMFKRPEKKSATGLNSCTVQSGKKWFICEQVQGHQDTPALPRDVRHRGVLGPFGVPNRILRDPLRSVKSSAPSNKPLAGRSGMRPLVEIFSPMPSKSCASCLQEKPSDITHGSRPKWIYTS